MDGQKAISEATTSGEAAVTLISQAADYIGTRKTWALKVPSGLVPDCFP